MSHPGVSCRDDERGRTSCPPLREVGNVIRRHPSRYSGIPSAIHHPSRHPPPLPSSTTPPVIPANAGIYVPSPVSYARECGVKAHGRSSLPSFRRTPESTSSPWCRMPPSCRTGTRYVIPPVFPAKAGIHVASLVSYAPELPCRHTVRHPSRLSGESRNPRRLPGVICP